MASHISEKIPPRVSSIQNGSDEMSRGGPPVPPRKFSTDSRVPTGEFRAGSPCSQNDTDASTMSKSGQLTDSEKAQRNRLRRGRSKQPQPRGEGEEQSSKRGIREKAKKYFPGMNSANQKTPQDLAKEPVARQIPGSLQPGMSWEELIEEVQALRRENDELRRGKPSPTSNAFPAKTESRGVDTSDLTNISTVQEKPNPGLVTVRIKDWNDQCRELKDVKEQLDLYESKMDEVFEELATEKSKRVEAQRRAKATLKELASVTKTEGNFFDDSHFRDAVIKLRYDVRSWARNQGWQEQRIRPRDSNKVLRPYLFLRDTCDTYAEYIKSELTLPWLMEAYLWQYLLSHVFGRYVWAESHNASLYGLSGRTLNAMTQWKDTLDREFSEESDHYEAFQNWRVAACRILAVRREVDIAAAVRRRVDDIRKILRPICINGAVDESGLTEIFRDAIGLDMLLQQERPDYTFYPRFSRSIHPEGLNYQPDSMEVENEDELAEIPEHLRRVKLVIQPSLQKYGNSAGRNYQDGFSVLDTVIHVSRMRESRY